MTAPFESGSASRTLLTRLALRVRRDVDELGDDQRDHDDHDASDPLGVGVEE